MKRFWNSAALAAVVMFVLTTTAQAQWGDLKITFKLDGAAPKPEKLMITKDNAVCAAPGKPALVDESLVVGKDGGVQNVFVYLVPKAGTKVNAHPSYEETAKDKVTLDNKNCRFEPHALAVRTGQTLILKNSDPTGHNSNLAFTANTPQNPLIAANGEIPIKPADLSKPEKRVTQVSCSIHPWMNAWILVQDHPYMAVSDENGVVEIKNLPVGKHTFQLWQENVGYVNPSGGKLKVTKGKVDIDIKAGANDLGEIKFKPKTKK